MIIVNSYSVIGENVSRQKLHWFWKKIDRKKYHVIFGTVVPWTCIFKSSVAIYLI